MMLPTPSSSTERTSDRPDDTMQVALEAYLAHRVGEAVSVSDLERVSSVGNAREPWSFTASWAAETVRCVMLVKAEAGQLETTLGPEFHTIARLGGSDVPVPRALWLDETGQWIGQPFFVTEWVPGTADTRLLRDPKSFAVVRAVALELAAAAARLHAIAVRNFEEHLPPATVDDAAITQLTAWHEVFCNQRMEPHPALAYAFTWLAARLPVARRVSVVHGDLRFGNLLYHDRRLTALLDWEMVHLGDPVEDLSWVYRTVWSPAAALPPEEFLDAYVAAGGDQVSAEHLRWYRVFSEVKHSVISLTAARSFADGRTTSLRHADRAATVPAFVIRLLELLDAPC
jgi:aminoglycoside phosphotransferase (APT) family kinase protein